MDPPGADGYYGVEGHPVAFLGSADEFRQGFPPAFDHFRDAHGSSPVESSPPVATVVPSRVNASAGTILHVAYATVFVAAHVAVPPGVPAGAFYAHLAAFERPVFATGDFARTDTLVDAVLLTGFPCPGGLSKSRSEE